MITGRNFRQALHAYRTGSFQLDEGGNSPIYLKNKTAVDAAAASAEQQKQASFNTITPKIAAQMTLKKQAAPVSSTATAPTSKVDNSDDDAGAVAENPDKFTFGSAKGSGKVSASELQKWRDSTGRSDGTLGQYMNARDGKTAVAGGKNDPNADDDAGAAAENPDKVSIPTPPPRPRSLSLPTTDVPTPVARPANLDQVKTQTPTPDTSEDEEDESGGKTKKKKNMKESLISRFMELHNSKSSNIFETAKKLKKVCPECGKSPCVCENVNESTKTPKAKDKPLDTLVKKVNEPKQKVDESAMSAQMHVHDTKSKNFAVDHISASTKEKEPMPKLKVNGIERDLKDGKVSTRGKVPAEPMPKLKTLDPMTKKLARESALEKLTAEELEALEEGFSKNPYREGTVQYKTWNNNKAKFDNKEGPFKEKEDPKKGLFMRKDTNIPKKVNEEDESLFSEEELAHLNSVLEEEGEEPVKRGRGRPKGSKSGSKLGRETGTEDGEVLGYGRKNLQAQIRPGNAPYFKNGTEVKKLVHPDTGTEHEVAMHHVRKFSDDLADAEKPHEKQAIEAAFRKRHMGS